MLRKSFLAGVCLLAFQVSTQAEVVLNRGSDGDPSTLDQHQSSTTTESKLLSDLYEGLVVNNGLGKIVPGAASRWEISPDGLTYVFYLRENAKWSNGDPVTASDFEYSLRRIMNPKTAAGYASVLYGIRNAEAVATGKLPLDQLGVKALDTKRLQITLNVPTPYFIELLAHQTSLPLHRQSVELHGEKFTHAGNMVSNGTYSLQSFEPNARIVMQKNPHHWDAANVKIDRVNWIPFENCASCMRRFEAGELQICSDVAVEQIDYVKDRLATAFRQAAYFGVYYLALKGEPGSKLRDPRVRQAINLILDRDFIAGKVWRGIMLPAQSLVPPGTSNYVADAPKVGFLDEDMIDREELAKSLLQEAGLAPGELSVKLRFNTSENHKNTMAAIADMLSRIGIKSSLDEMEGASYFKKLQNKEMFDLARSGWIGDYNDPVSFLGLYTTGNYFNYSEWSSPRYDALLAQSSTTLDMKERARLLAEAERILLDESAYVPLMYYSSTALVSPKVQGYSDNIMNAHATRWLSLQ